MQNIIDNIPAGAIGGSPTKKGFELARHMADEYEAETGRKCIIQRILDYTDEYNGEPRYHYSFDIIEILPD